MTKVARPHSPRATAMSTTIYELADLARRYVREHYPDLRGPVEVRVVLTEDLAFEAVQVEIVPGESTAEPPPAEPASEPPPAEPSPGEAWVPTLLQRQVLAALEGDALRADELGAVTGDRRGLFQAGGLRELQDRGLVRKDPRLGYYRPDLPPAELAGGQ
jgi:hypothetical protein